MKELRAGDYTAKVESLCELFGKSRQAYYQRSRNKYRLGVKEEILKNLVRDQRKLMPRIGGRKLHHIIQGQLPPEIRIGRDAFFDFLRGHHLLIRKRRNKVKTTFSHHWLRKYPNLIREFVAQGPHQLWVSDITYLGTSQGFIYLFLITDAYSRKIIGWSVSQDLEAKNAVSALQMALRQLPDQISDIFHHSDRGVQYCSEEYVKLLKKRGIKISMTENGDPLENAIAERINGILKSEWVNHMELENITQAKRQLGRIISIYNTERPHTSIDMETPQGAHMNPRILKRRWKNYYKKQQEITVNLE